MGSWEPRDKAGSLKEQKEPILKIQDALILLRSLYLGHEPKYFITKSLSGSTSPIPILLMNMSNTGF